MGFATILRATVSVTILLAILIAVPTAWIQLEETPEQSNERVRREQGACQVGYFECEKQLKTFEMCTAISPADAALCEAVQLDGTVETCESAGGGNKCLHNNRPGIRTGVPLCIPNALVRNGYYDCIGTQEACTAIDEDVARDVELCAAVELNGNAETCTSAGDCKYWGVDAVSDFSDEKSLEWQMYRLIAVIAIIGGSVLVFSICKLISTTVAIYQKPKDEIEGSTSADQYRTKQP